MTETNQPENLTITEILEKIRRLEAELHHEQDELATWYEHG